jgi:hypothetical protein
MVTLLAAAASRYAHIPFAVYHGFRSDESISILIILARLPLVLQDILRPSSIGPEQVPGQQNTNE